MKNLKSTFAKKDIQNRLNISLATVNNWIKTGVIPSPENGYYTKDVYSNLIKTIENSNDRLQSRANRSNKNSSNIIFLGIKDKKRKELLFELVEEFKKNKLSVIESIACLGKQILIDNNLYDEKSEIYLKINKIYSGNNIFKNFHKAIKNFRHRE